MYVISFLDFLQEEKALTKKRPRKQAKSKSKITKDGFGNDEKGKLFELGVGFHLKALAAANSQNLPKDHPARKIKAPLNDDGSFHHDLMPSHFRQEGVGPKEIHDGIVAGIKKQHGENWKQHYDSVMSHARQTANAIVNHAVKSGHIASADHIRDVHWTSQGDKEDAPGDHERLTGKKDTLSTADLIITHHANGKKKQFLGASLKYGAQDKPNYKNPGTDAMSQISGAKIGDHWKAHQARMATQLGYTGSAEERHKQWKSDYELPDNHPRKQLAIQAEESALKAKNSEAKEFHAGLAKKSSEDLRGIASNLTNPPTVHKTLHVHGLIDPKYHGGFYPKVQEANEKFNAGIEKYKSFNVGKSPEGSSVVIYGEPHDEHKGKVPTRIVSLSLKGSSGPHKGIVGAVKADFLTHTKDLSHKERTPAYKRYMAGKASGKITHSSFASYLAASRGKKGKK